MEVFKHNNIELFWLKHAGFKIKTPDGLIYIDPLQIPADSEKADILFISHDHFDHLDPNSIRAITNGHTHIFCAQDCVTKIGDLVQAASIEGMDCGEEKIFGHLKINATPAYNTNKPFHPKEKGWLGFVIEVEDTKIYYAGDTDHLEELRGVQCDIGLFPVSGIYLMDPTEAADLANHIKPKLVSIPYHYGAISTDEGKPIGTQQDAELFCQKCQSNPQILSPINS